MTLSIGELVGTVTLDTSGVRRGVAQTQSAMGGLGKNMGRQGIEAANGWVRGADGKLRNSRGRFVSSGEQVAAGLGQGIQSKSGVLGNAWSKAIGAIAIGQAVKSAITLEATYGKTMAQIQASTGASGAEMEKLDKMAVKLGADTSFSSGEAAGAMLELAKAGVSTADIMGGALSGTLTLAAAGGTDLATASTIASSAMNTFGLKGTQMADVAAALAGGANASSASVESLGEALSQVGPGATNAGLSLQETIGALAAFDSAGIKGSDAGTSLKQMLASLVPTTKSATLAMESVGLWTEGAGSKFVKANGQFKSMSEISGLLHRKLSGLSEAQRSAALTSIFGSDASRAATVLMKEGSKGINGYIKATKDKDAAEKMAKANMSGTAGTLERMNGSLETAAMSLGTLFAPATRKAAEGVGKLAGWVSKAAGYLQDHTKVAIALAAVIGVLTAVTATHAAVMAVSAAGGMAKWLMQTKLISAATKVWAAIQWVMNAALAANPLLLIVIGIAALVAAVVLAYQKVGWFRAGVDAAFAGIKSAVNAVVSFFSTAISWLIDFVKNHWQLIVAIITGPLGAVVILVIKHWDKIKSVTTGAVSRVVGFVRSIPEKFRNALSGLGGLLGRLFSGAMNAAKDKVTGIGSAIVGWITSIPGKLGALGGKFASAGRSLLQKFIDGMKNAAGIISGIAGNVWNAVKGLLDKAIDKINNALEFTIDLPGPKNLHVDLPNIPHLATGGRVTSDTIARIGEKEPETVLRDRDIVKLLTKARDAGRSETAANTGRNAPLIGAVHQQPGESAGVLAERLWFLTQTRG